MAISHAAHNLDYVGPERTDFNLLSCRSITETRYAQVQYVKKTKGLATLVQKTIYFFRVFDSK